MERNTLEKFFTSKHFVIPSYQRDYAWTQQNIDDLFNDIAETIETRTSHYIGTFILSRNQGDGAYHVVDGQQRLTTLKSLQADKEGLNRFVALYVKDLRKFFGSLLKLVQRVRTEPRYYKMFCMLGLSTHLYPLAIRLQGRGILDDAATRAGLTYADLVEIADVRIYKTRGTDPQKDISHLACDAATAEPDVIRSRLAEIVLRFMDDGRFESYLRGNMYGNEALLHILMEQGESWSRHQGKPSEGGVVRLVWLETFTKGGQLEIVDHADGVALDQVVRNVWQAWGWRKYDLLAWNCEHFANWCSTHRARSFQVEGISTTAMLVLGCWLFGKLAA